MKNIKKLSLLFSTLLILTSVFCINVFAEGNEAFIVDTRTIYAEIPANFNFFPFYDSFYFSNTDGDCIQILQAENFNLENGVKKLTKERAFDLYKYYFDIDISFYDYKIKESKVEKINGISSYVISGEILTEYTECDSYDDESGNIVPGDYCSQYFIVYIFATKENTIIVSYESGGEKTKKHIEEAEKLIKTVLINGTYFYNEKLSVSHNFVNSPEFDDAIQIANENYNPADNMDMEFFGPLVAIFSLILLGPIIIFIVVAIINITNYSKNKKKLRQYEMTYGSVPSYMPPQNFGGYNQPVNTPYQPPVNPVYQQNPVNQNYNQTPSYVTNAVNNLEASQQPTQPAQNTYSSEMQDAPNNN